MTTTLRWWTAAGLAAALAACDEAPAPEPLSAVPHCNPDYAWPVDPADADIHDDPVLVFAENDPDDPDDDGRDVILPAAVVAWIEEQGWKQQHDDWHNVRRWDQGCRTSDARVEGPDGVAGTDDDCASAQRLLDRGLYRAPIQEGAPGDGVAFLAMHRHMIDGIRKAFPGHPELFAGFDHVPRGQDDPENPMPWRDVRWSAAQLAAIDKLEHIEDHVDEFATEDELGLYIEVPFRWTPENPSGFVADGSSGLHFMLHAQWSVAGSPVNLGIGENLILNRVFWDLHGWIDTVWERYRVARGLTRDDREYQEALVGQCEEMHDQLDLRPHAGHAQEDAP